MDIKILSLAALIAALTGCAGSRETARLKDDAPSLGAHLAPLSVEPLGCAVYAGEDRPDYDAQALGCIVGWMGEAREFIANGGQPTKQTSNESFESNRATAKKLMARVSRWLGETRLGAPAPAGSGEPARAPFPLDAGLDSQQHYLMGVISFQKGDLEGARRQWLRAQRLDPANADARAGLERLGKAR